MVYIYAVVWSLPLLWYCKLLKWYIKLKVFNVIDLKLVLAQTEHTTLRSISATPSDSPFVLKLAQGLGRSWKWQFCE